MRSPISINPSLELLKLTSRKVSRQTVANVMRENGLDPGPKLVQKTLDEFMKMHAESLWQCDFFCKRVGTYKGVRDFYVLAFLHVGTRRVWTSPSTAHPDDTWVRRQEDAFCEHVRDNELQADVAFHDADTKLGKGFDAALTAPSGSRRNSVRTLQVERNGSPPPEPKVRGLNPLGDTFHTPLAGGANWREPCGWVAKRALSLAQLPQRFDKIRWEAILSNFFST